jgi:hypothetical protein
MGLEKKVGAQNSPYKIWNFDPTLYGVSRAGVEYVKRKLFFNAYSPSSVVSSSPNPALQDVSVANLAFVLCYCPPNPKIVWANPTRPMLAPNEIRLALIQSINNDEDPRVKFSTNFILRRTRFLAF